MGIFKLNGIDYMGGGGGGNANEQVLTWDEYCALTEEEKTNGTTYYINDINGDGQSFQPVIFSLEEREIGVWMDGKPLYEKTVTFTNVSRTGVIDLDLINVDNIFVHNGKYGQYIPLPYVHSDMGNGIGGFFETDSNGKWIWNVRGGSYASSVTGWMTVRYTKTTDQPGSGTWTPQGVPAVHYSTDEQVVGTWIDGSTIYEKTYTGLSVGTNGPTWVQIAAIDTSGMSDIIDCIAFMNTPTGLLRIALGEYVSTGSVLQVTVVNSIFNRTINIITLRYTKTTS